MNSLQIPFWITVGLLVYTQFGYPLLLLLLRTLKVGSQRAAAPAASNDLPKVTVVIAAYNEAKVIEAKVANVLALDYPRELLEVVVASDGSADDTVALARAAGADQVLDLPRGGKIRAQDQAVECSSGELIAFSDANSLWQPDALRELVGCFEDPKIGYVCGRVNFQNADGTNQEGLYWRYEMFIRGLESGLASITAGNGAIYATRRESYIQVDPIMGHDLSFPFNMVKRGWRAIYRPSASANEQMVPSIEGEFSRKRRMMSHTWPILFRGGILSPKGYSPLYFLMILSHRLLRYLTPFLHAAVLLLNVALLWQGRYYYVLLILQLLVLAGAAFAGVVRLRPLLIMRYYVLTTFAIAAGLYDWLRHGTKAEWEQAEGTR